MNAMTAVIAAPAHGVGDMERMAKAIAKSGLFGIRTTDQALALMLIAQAEGRHPATAARDYDIIGGRPAKKAEAMLRDFLAAGGSVEWLALTDTLCRARFSHASGGSATIEWAIERAVKAGIVNDMWRRYPRQMLRCRVVSEGVRTVYPMATSGLYVDEEIQALDLLATAAGGDGTGGHGDAPQIGSEVEPEAEIGDGTDGEVGRGDEACCVGDPTDPQPGQIETAPPEAELPSPSQTKRKSARQLKASGEDLRIKAEIDGCDLAQLAAWDIEFEVRTAHLPRAWLDAVRDWIALRREEVLLRSARLEMDHEYAAVVS